MKQQAHTKPPVKLWIDSGAFSVWQAGGKGRKVEPISLPAYIDFIKQREHLIECYISLDEMPRASRHVWGARQLDSSTSSLKSVSRKMRICWPFRINSSTFRCLLLLL